jgi:hypothetical protein
VIPEVEWMQVYTLDNMAVGIDENELMTWILISHSSMCVLLGKEVYSIVVYTYSHVCHLLPSYSTSIWCPWNSNTLQEATTTKKN